MGKKLLSFLLLGIIALSLSACGAKEGVKTDGTTTAETTVAEGTIPYNYPTVATTAKVGDYVLVPSKKNLEDAVKDPANTSFLFDTAKMTTPGEKQSEVESSLGEKYTMPNSLIVPIKSGETAEKGDVVLTWWQSGFDMEKALVLEGGATPKVRYLDSFVEDEETLVANSFHKLTGELEPGVSVAIKGDFGDELATVINVSGDKVLVAAFADMLQVVNKDAVTILPLKIDVNVGDTIMAPVIGTFEPVTVKEVKADIGQVVGEYTWVDELTQKTFVYGEIVKELK